MCETENLNGILSTELLKMNSLNNLIDYILPFYSLFIIIIILFYNKNITLNKNKKLNLNFKIIKNNSIEKNKNENNNENNNESNSIEIKDWKEIFNGVWQQTEHENFEEFLIFSDTSYVIRKLAPLVFSQVYHTITINLEKKEFKLLRDFGPGRKEFLLDFKISSNEDEAELIYNTVDTGEKYSFKLWINDELKTLYVKSTPIDLNKGVIITHSRTFINENKMKMVWDGYNLQHKTTCQMVSYFERVER